MNYRVFNDTQFKPLLANFESLPEFRPTIGDIITIAVWPNQWKITNMIPPPNPNPPANVTIDYFVRPINSSPDSITMGKDIAKMTRAIRYLGKRRR